MHEAIHYLRNYKWNSVFFRYWISIFLILLIPFLLLDSIIFLFNAHSQQNKILTEQLNTLYQCDNHFNQISYEADMTYNILNKQPEIASYMAIHNNDSVSGYERTKISQKVYDLMQNMTLVNSNISSIYLYNTAMNYVLGSNVSNFLPDMTDQSWYTLYNNTPYILPRTVQFDLNTVHYLSYCYEIYIDNKKSGLLIINMNLDNIGISMQAKNAKIFAISDDNLIFFAPTDDLLRKDIYALNEYKHLPDIDSIRELQTLKSDNMLISIMPSAHRSYTLIHVSDKLSSYSEIKSTQILIVITFFITLLLSFLLSFFVSFQIYKSIASIIISLDTPDKVHIKRKKQNELMYIISNIAHSINHTQHINSELSRRLLALRKSQSIALQTQITPHFLYNTLQIINLVTMRVCKGDNEASQMIVLFSELLHNTLDTEEYLIPLKKEVQFTKQYLELQQMKYKNHFTVTWDLDPATLDFQVVKLSLQPILENALHHGILPLKKSGYILIRSFIHQKHLCIDVINDGKIIEPDQLRQLNAQFETNESITETKNIGLSNVNQRIKLAFGPECGCHIETDDKYTIVRLTMNTHQFEE